MGVGCNRPFRGSVISSVTVNTLANGVVNTPYNQTASAVMIDPNDGSYAVAWSGSGVAGLSINPTTGAITGTPTAAGTYTVTCSVTDSSGNNVTDTGTVTVTAAKAAKAK